LSKFARVCEWTCGRSKFVKSWFNSSHGLFELESSHGLGRVCPVKITKSVESLWATGYKFESISRHFCFRPIIKCPIGQGLGGFAKITWLVSSPGLRSRTFYPTPDVQLNYFLHRTPKTGILLVHVEMARFLSKVLLKQISSCCAPQFQFDWQLLQNCRQSSFIHVMLRSRNFWKGRVGKFWKLGVGIGHFNSDSTTLVITSPLQTGVISPKFVSRVIYSIHKIAVERRNQFKKSFINNTASYSVLQNRNQRYCFKTASLTQKNNISDTYSVRLIRGFIVSLDLKVRIFFLEWNKTLDRETQSQFKSHSWQTTVYGCLWKTLALA